MCVCVWVFMIIVHLLRDIHVQSVCQYVHMETIDT